MSAATMQTPAGPSASGGTPSTAEIKARIEALFADRPEPSGTRSGE
ncbi:hypothetical protein GCM10023094_35140 [Rhodococcus olei]|uniref:Uncharacterized protein n=1 Tax=Rhodococcus olei TaxID=2161675 RepID=A0ABP8PBF4_9NOCA